MERTFTVPQDPGRFVFSYDGLNFDTSDPDSVKDALEVALLQPADGAAMTYTISPGRDAYFNLTEGMDPLAATAQGVQAGPDPDGHGTQVAVDISHLVPGSTAKVILRLVNNDQDTGTWVHIFGRRDEPPTVTAALANDTAPEGGPPELASDGLTNDATVTGTVATAA